MMKREFLRTWDWSCGLTLRFAQAMPEEKGDFRPVGDMMSFREQLLHILHAEQWFLQGMERGSWESPTEYTPENFPNMASVKQALEMRAKTHRERIEAIEDWDTAVDNPILQKPVPKRTLLQMLISHETHHRGQLVVYLRLNGVEPPSFSGR